MCAVKSQLRVCTWIIHTILTYLKMLMAVRVSVANSYTSIQSSAFIEEWLHFCIESSPEWSVRWHQPVRYSPQSAQSYGFHDGKWWISWRKMMDFVRRMMDFVRNMMDFVGKMMDFAGTNHGFHRKKDDLHAKNDGFHTNGSLRSECWVLSCQDTSGESRVAHYT